MKAFILFVFFTFTAQDDGSGVAKYMIVGKYSSADECITSSKVMGNELRKQFMESDFSTMQFSCVEVIENKGTAL